MRSSIIRLDKRAARDPRRTGGKGAGLARLVARGFGVPAGFVLTTDFFPEAPSAPDASGLLDPSLRRRLHDEARRLGGPFAVRSSLVEEDGRRASLAGQLASILDVPEGEALEEAVRRCHASAFADHLAIYRKNLLDGEADSVAGRRLAVVVQRMQSSRVVGVAFSADPLTGQRCVVIESAAGSPDAVVAGKVDPDRWRVDARGVLVEKCPSRGSGCLLAEEHVLELAALVRGIAADETDPIDVEWCWDGDRFWFLQARPISTLAGKHVYSNRLVADMSPGLIKPLLWSTNTLGMTCNVLGPVFDGLLGPTGLDYSRLARRIHSRLYTDMTILGDLFVRLGMPPNSFEIMARDETGHRPSFKPNLRQLVKMRRGIPFLWRHGRVAKEVRSFLRDQNAALEEFRGRDWRGTPSPELLDAAGRLAELHGRSQWYIFLVALNSMVRKRILDRMVRRHAPERDPADLIRGLAGLKALEPNRRLQELAAMAGRLPAEERACLSAESCEAIEEILGRSAEGRRLLEGFEAFQNDFGFLSANGTDISGASWAEKPALVWRLVARPQESHDLRPAEEAVRIRRRSRREVRAALHPAQRGFFSRLLKSTVVYLNLRERVSLLLSEDAYEMRRVFLALGDRLVNEAGFSTREDVFYLFLDELKGLVAGDTHAAEARCRVAERKDEMERDAGIHPPDTLCGDRIQAAPIPADSPEGYLVGIGGSSGIVEGRARIVADPLQAPPDLGPGDILVVPFTDVGWTPLFAGISGIIAETGGQLSHTAIVAREYNLPAVVSVPGVMTILRDFQPITVDGQSGRVFLEHLSARKELPA